MTTSITCPKCRGRGTLPDQSFIGQRFRRARLRAGLSASQVADAMKCSRSLLERLERGQRTWKKKHIKSFKRAIGSIGSGKRLARIGAKT